MDPSYFVDLTKDHVLTRSKPVFTHCSTQSPLHTIRFFYSPNLGPRKCDFRQLLNIG